MCPLQIIFLEVFFSGQLLILQGHPARLQIVLPVVDLLGVLGESVRHILVTAAASLLLL